MEDSSGSMPIGADGSMGGTSSDNNNEEEPQPIPSNEERRKRRRTDGGDPSGKDIFDFMRAAYVNTRNDVSSGANGEIVAAKLEASEQRRIAAAAETARKMLEDKLLAKVSGDFYFA